MRRTRIALTTCALLALAALSTTALAGNSAAVKQCQKNGWQSLYTRTGQPFASQKACTSYANGGGVLLPEAGLACLGGGWARLGPTPSIVFASEQACVDHVLTGGAPVPAGADISLAVAGAGDIDSLAVECNPGWRITVSNGGPLDAFVEVDITIYGPVGAFGFNPGWSIPVQVADDGTSRTFRTSRTIAAGEATRIDASPCGDEGLLTVYSSSVQDPDSTPGNGYVAGEDDGVSISGSGPA